MFDRHSAMLETLEYWERKRKFDTPTGNIVAWGVVGAGICAMAGIVNPALLIAAKSFVLSKGILGLKVAAGVGALVRGVSFFAKNLKDS